MLVMRCPLCGTRFVQCIVLCDIVFGTYVWNLYRALCALGLYALICSVYCSVWCFVTNIRNQVYRAPEFLWAVEGEAAISVTVSGR